MATIRQKYIPAISTILILFRVLISLNSKQLKQKRLKNEIINIYMNFSSLTATDFLKDSVAYFGKSTICNFLKKDPPIIVKERIRKICIDDFAIKKKIIIAAKIL